MNIKNTPSIDSGLRWLFVDMNSFFASCEQERNPALRGRPVAVAPVLTDSTCAIAASTEAKAFGIKTGTPIWQARKLCPALQVVEARPKVYVQYHHKILDAIETIIPIEAVMSIDEMACRLDKVQQPFEKAQSLAKEIKASLRDRVGAFLTCSIGLASNRLLAKLASDMQKPDGLVVLHPALMPAPILHLKPEAIYGIGRHMAERIRQAGIEDMASLWAADAQYLKRIWGGIVGLRFHAVLHGADLDSPINPRRSMSHQHVLAPDKRTKDKATSIIRQLLERVASRLRDENFYSCRMILEVKWVQNLGYYADERTFKETQDTRYLLSILMELWQKVPLLKPLRIGVTLADLKPQASHQPDLFDVPRSPHLTRAIDALNARYGRGTLSYGAVSPSMTSKIAFRRIPKLDEF